MKTKPTKLSNCCNEPVYIHSMAMKCSKCNNACTIAENKQSVSAKRVLNQIEPNGELLTTELAIKAMEVYSNIVNATIIRKVEQLQSEATVNLKTMEALDKAFQSMAQVVKDEYGEAGMTNTGNKIYKKILVLTKAN